jgi:hypothetical protein
MEPGFMHDSDSMGGACVSHWAVGMPEKGFFGHLKARGVKKLETETFRCMTCGFLETYATQDYRLVRPKKRRVGV